MSTKNSENLAVASGPSPWTNESIIEFDLNDVVGVRLVEASPGDIASLTTYFGTPCVLDRQPDITIRFVNEISVPGLRYLGLNSSGFDDDAFYMLDRKSGHVVGRVPFEKIGSACEIVCANLQSLLPVLLDITTFTFLAKGYVAIHASAFLYKDAGFLVVGWEKGGKTETLLAFANHHAKYVGDEVILLSADGREMFGLPVPVAIWAWQFEQIPELMPRIPTKKKVYFAGVRFLEALHRLFAKGPLRTTLLFELLNDVLPPLRQRLKVFDSPAAIFKQRIHRQPVAIDKVLLVMSHSKPDTIVERCDPNEVVERMKSSNDYERTRMLDFYKSFKFAFPHLENEFLETVNARQGESLAQALEGKDAYKVLHPYPPVLEELFAKVRNVL